MLSDLWNGSFLLSGNTDTKRPLKDREKGKRKKEGEEGKVEEKEEGREWIKGTERMEGEGKGRERKQMCPHFSLSVFIYTTNTITSWKDSHENMDNRTWKGCLKVLVLNHDTNLKTGIH